MVLSYKMLRALLFRPASLYFYTNPVDVQWPRGGDRRFSDVSLQNLTPRSDAMVVRFAHMLSPEDQQRQDHFIHDHFAYPLPRYAIPG